jgi:hypothetical protein
MQFTASLYRGFMIKYWRQDKAAAHSPEEYFGFDSGRRREDSLPQAGHPRGCLVSLERRPCVRQVRTSR